MKYPNSDKWVNLTEHIDMSWKNDVLEIFTYYTERTAGSFIEHKRCALTWHYRLADPEYGAFQAKECQNHLETALSKLPVEVLAGKKNLEVRPKLINKGEIVKRLLLSSSTSLSNNNNVSCFDFTLACGDDSTDEDMYKYLQLATIQNNSNKFSIFIGPKDRKTTASWNIPNVQDMINTLTKMAAISSV